MAHLLQNPFLTGFWQDVCPNQDKLTNLIDMYDPDEDMTEYLNHCKTWAAIESVDKAVSEHNVDVVVCCSDSFFAGVSVAAREYCSSYLCPYFLWHDLWNGECLLISHTRVSHVY